MKKNIVWLRTSIILITLTIISTAIFNYKVDSLGTFGNSNYLSLAAKSLTNGNMIAGLKNYDERLLQQFVINNLKVNNNVIAIGSSRTLQLRKQFFLEDSVNFFNHSVSGASLEDYISIIGIYESTHNYLPSTIILGVDPWVFNKYNSQTRWKTLSKYYNYEVNKIYGKALDTKSGINSTKWQQLINYEYTISNIKFFKTMSTNDNKAFYTPSHIDLDDSIKDTDGSTHRPQKLRHPNYELVKSTAISFAKGNAYSLKNFTTLSNTKLFEDFIKYLQSNNVMVILFLPPYNPFAYDILTTRYQYIEISENYLNTLAKKYNVLTIGSYNPHKYGLTNHEFLDGMHSLENVSKKIFSPHKEDIQEIRTVP
jgi:hypothetical protein